MKKLRLILFVAALLAVSGTASVFALGDDPKPPCIPGVDCAL